MKHCVKLPLGWPARYWRGLKSSTKTFDVYLSSTLSLSYHGKEKEERKSEAVFPTLSLALPLAVEPLAAQQPVEAAAEAVGDDVRCQAPRHLTHLQSHRLASGRFVGLKMQESFDPGPFL